MQNLAGILGGLLPDVLHVAKKWRSLGGHDYITCKRYSNPWIGPQGSRRLWLPDFQAIGGEVVNATHEPLLPPPPGNIPGTHFRSKLSRSQGHSAAGMIKSMKISSDTIGESNPSQPTAPPRARFVVRVECGNSVGMIGDFRFKFRPGELQQYRITELAIA